MRRLLRILAVLVSGVVVWLGLALLFPPSLEPYASHRVGVADAGQLDSGDGLRVTFLGVSSLLISDGETSLMTDGFFSRPGRLKLLLGEVEPDRAVIAETLARFGVDRLAAVMVVHSHYDHSMDAPEVAMRTGAVLLGSESTANVGRGWGLPEDRIRVVESGRGLRFGSFELTAILSRHVDFGLNRGSLGGEIREPLVPPAPPLAYAEGGSYSVHIAHPQGNLLIQGSAGYLEGALQGYAADTVFLGVAALGIKEPEYQAAYFREVLGTLGARRVIPIHYDDFTRPLTAPIRLLPSPFSRRDGGIDALLAHAEADAGIEFLLLPVGASYRIPPPGSSR